MSRRLWWALGWMEMHTGMKQLLLQQPTEFGASVRGSLEQGCIFRDKPLYRTKG